MKIRLALLQLNPGNKDVENFEIAKKAIQESVSQGADIALLPELWNVGYSSPEEYSLGKEAWQEAALTKEDSHFLLYQNLAKELNIGILFPYLERKESMFMNSAALIDRNGKVVLNYQKVHTVDKGWEVLFESGNDFPVVELDTKSGLVKIGCMICYDREFPESARILMLNGAELVLVPNACGLDLNRLHQFQSRAFENMFGVAMTNYPTPKNNGRSCAYSGMRVKENFDYDPTLILANDIEGVFYADFDIEELRNYRKIDIWGDAYRKPRLYEKLIENNPKPPFIRPNARR
jgi:predicted amidohydrolase